MSQYVHMVFSDPPVGVNDDEFNAWYDAHVQEILAVPGFESVRRYAISSVVGPEGSGDFRFLAVYQLSCEPAQAIAALESHGLGSADSYTELKDGGVRTASTPRLVRRRPLRIVELHRHRRHDHTRNLNPPRLAPTNPGEVMAHNLYLVFSKPPTGVSSEEFHRWYADHAQENIESPRFVSAQRYTVRRLIAGVEEP